MKTKDQVLGSRGEELAARHLEALGYRILDRNWRDGHRELDLVALDGDTLVFAEVKTRGEGGSAKPEEAVSQLKRKHLAQAAAAYLARMEEDYDIRFDIIAIREQAQGRELHHIEDAFFPGG